MGNIDPKVLNLDELEADESDITIVHKSVKHLMRVLTVDAFIEQQKRAIKQQKMAAEAEAAGDREMTDVLELIRDSIQEFFPTLPVGELPTPKLFVIFGWLNEMSEKVNQADAPAAGEGVTSTEGKAEAEGS